MFLQIDELYEQARKRESLSALALAVATPRASDQVERNSTNV